MVAIGLLEGSGDRYANSPVAATFLSGATPADLRPLLRFWDRLSYPAWEDLAGALGRGRPAHEIFEIDDELVPVMSAGIAAATAAACRALPEVAGLPAASRVLDIGGGTGSWSIALAAADPALTATVLELAEVARVARDEQLRQAGYSDRIDVRVGDVLADDLPRGLRRLPARQPGALLHAGDEPVDPAADPGGRRTRRPPAHRRLLDRPDSHPAAPGRADGRRVRDPRQRRRRLQRRGGRSLARGHRLEG